MANNASWDRNGIMACSKVMIIKVKIAVSRNMNADVASFIADNYFQKRYIIKSKVTEGFKRQSVQFSH